MDICYINDSWHFRLSMATRKGGLKGSLQKLGELTKVGEPIERNQMTKLCDEVESEALRLSQTGLTQREVGRLIGISKSAVGNVIVRDAARRFAPKPWNPSPALLSMSEREEIRVGLERGDTFTTIARSIGRAIATARGRLPTTTRESTIERPRRTALLSAARGDQSPESSSPAHCATRSSKGWSSGGPPRRSLAGCGSNTQTIR